MKSAFPFLALVVSVSTVRSAPHDMLRFANGDQLRGSFVGFGGDGVAELSRGGMKEPIRFNRRGLEQVVLRGGRTAQAAQGGSGVVLENGDVMPGKIRSIDASSVVLETSFAGSLTIPRGKVAAIRPNSSCGTGLVYTGPFLEEDWLNFSHPSAEGTDQGSRAAPRGGWRFEGGSWFWAGGESVAPLALPRVLPDRFICSMVLEWTGSPCFSIGYRADLEPLTGDSPVSGRGERKAKDGVWREAAGSSVLEPHRISPLIGNANVVVFNRNHSFLGRSKWKQANGSLKQLGNTYRFSSFGVVNRCRVEIRSDRSRMDEKILIDGRPRYQWQGPPEDERQGEDSALEGKALCFLVNDPSSSLRISEIRIFDWDSGNEGIRAMEARGRDLLLLADGSDRMAGTVLGTNTDGTISFQGSYGTLSIPMDRIGEIRMASPGVVPDSAPGGGSALVHLGSAGALRGEILPAPDLTRFVLKHPLLGDLSLLRDAVSLIEFGYEDRIAFGVPLDDESEPE